MSDDSRALPKAGAELPKAYEPAEVEERWYRFWRERGYFHGDEGRSGETFSMVIPPPNGESLELTAKRTLPFYERAIGGDLRQGKNVLVVAHGNSNRSIVMKLDKLTGEAVVGVELETGVPLVYVVSPEGEVVSKTIRK